MSRRVDPSANLPDQWATTVGPEVRDDTRSETDSDFEDTHRTRPLTPPTQTQSQQTGAQELTELLQHFDTFKRAFFALQGRCQQVMDRIEQEQAATTRRQRESEASLAKLRALGPRTVKLNVGGTLFEVSESLLRQHPGSFFAVLLEGNWPIDTDESGAIFVDRDPIVFRDVLYYLRTGDVPPAPSRPAFCAHCAAGPGGGAEAAMAATAATGTQGGATAAAQRAASHDSAAHLVLDFRRLEEEARFFGLTDLSMKLTADRGVWHRQGEHHVVEGNVPSPRCFAAWEYVGNETIYMFGGCTADDKFFDAFYVLRVGESIGQTAGDVAVQGASSPKPAARAGRSHDVIDVYTWHRVKARYGTPPTPRSGHTMSHVAGHLVVIGGNNSIAMEPSCHSFNILAGGWTHVHNHGEPLHPRSGHTVCVVQDQLYLIGGKQIFPSMRTYADVLVGSFNSDNGVITWRRANMAAPIEPRAYHSAIAYNDTIYVYGGIENNVYSRDLCRFETHTGVWTVISTTNTPGYISTLPRSGHMAALYGHEMVVFGSYSEDSNEMTLQSLDLTTLTWRTVETKGPAPLRRAAPSGAVIPALPFRGKMARLLVFGGFDIAARRCFNEIHVISL